MVAFRLHRMTHGAFHLSIHSWQDSGNFRLWISMLRKPTRNFPNGFLLPDVNFRRYDSWDRDNICLRSYNWHVRGTKSCDSSVCWFRHLLNRHLSIRTNHPDSLGLPCSWKHIPYLVFQNQAGRQYCADRKSWCKRAGFVYSAGHYDWRYAAWHHRGHHCLSVCPKERHWFLVRNHKQSFHLNSTCPKYCRSTWLYWMPSSGYKRQSCVLFHTKDWLQIRRNHCLMCRLHYKGLMRGFGRMRNWPQVHHRR